MMRCYACRRRISLAAYQLADRVYGPKCGQAAGLSVRSKPTRPAKARYRKSDNAAKTQDGQEELFEVQV